MNSTESAKAEAKAQAVHDFFDQELMPLATRFKAAGRPLFATAADDAVTSYFSARARTVMGRDDFILKGVGSPAAFAQALRDHWQRSRFPEMVTLGATLGTLAELLRGEPEKDEALSPFMYVMF